MLYVVEERGTFFQRFIAFCILLGGLYQGQLYYTNIILEETITLLVHYTYTNALPMCWVGGRKDQELYFKVLNWTQSFSLFKYEE